VSPLRPIAGLLTAIGLVAITANAAPVTALAFTPDGKALLVGTGNTLRVIAVATGKEQNREEAPFARITDLEFSPNGKRVAIAGGLPGSSGTVQLRRWPGGEVERTIDGFTDQVTAVSFHPDGRRIAVASADRTVVVHDLGKPKGGDAIIYRLVNHSRAVLDVGYDAEGRFLVTASADRSLKVWESESGRAVRSLGNHTEIVNAVAIRPSVRFGDGVLPFYCASASDDRTVRVWQPGIGRMVRIVRYHDAEVNAVVWHPDGDRLYSADRAGVIRVIDGESDRILGQWQAHDDWIYRLVINKDGSRLASGDWTGSVKIWEEQDGKATLIRVINGR